MRERTREELIRDVHNFYDRHKLKNDELRGVELKDVVDVDLLVKGALIARDPAAVETCGLTGPQKLAITSEPVLGLFQQTKELKVIILTTACAAIIQYAGLYIVSLYTNSLQRLATVIHQCQFPWMAMRPSRQSRRDRRRRLVVLVL